MFLKTVENAGVRDPKINSKGRPKGAPKPTNREIKERELILMLRKIKPHIADAILSAAKIMKNREASHQNQLKAATILLEHYRKLMLDVYDGEDADEEGTEIQQQNSAVFSLKVINSDDETSIETSVEENQE